MRIKTLLLFLSVSIAFSCTQQQPEQEKTEQEKTEEVKTEKTTNCASFKTGTFHYYSKISGIEFLVERNDSVQTETNLKTRQTVRTHIQWTGECTYELTLIDENIEKPTSPEMMAKKQQTTILSTNENYCVFSSIMEGTLTELKDTLWIEGAKK